MVDGRWSMVDGRWSMVDGRWSTCDARRTTPILLLNKLLPQPVGMIEAPSALGRARAVEPHFRTFMSQHPSLRASSTTGTKRNVLKRFERVEVLKKRGQWKDGDRVTGLRKTKAAE
jgi:small basic protein (TIGR04137 family)